MDAMWLLSRADESVVAIGCCVKWVGLIMQISRVGGAYCVRTPILPLLKRTTWSRWTSRPSQEIRWQRVSRTIPLLEADRSPSTVGRTSDSSFAVLIRSVYCENTGDLHRHCYEWSNLAQRWRLVRRWCAHLDLWKTFLNCGKICQNRRKTANSKNAIYPLAWWRHIYGQVAFTWRYRASGFSTHYLSQCGALRTLWR